MIFSTKIIENTYAFAKATIAFLGMFVFVATPVLAQEQNVSAIQATISRFGMVLPAVYVDELEIQQQSDEHVSGSFVIYNSESAAIGDVTYKILIISPPPEETIDELTSDDFLVYDIQTVNDRFTLNPKERKSVSFEVDIPALPKGDYRLRIQLAASNDREFGWGDSDFSVTTDNPFVYVSPLQVKTDSYDPFDPAKTIISTWDPLSGVNVDAGQAATFTATITNSSEGAQAVVPVIAQRRILTSTSTTEVTRGRQIMLGAEEKRIFSMQVQAEDEPGAHQYLLTFETVQGNKISGIGEYRLVVRGPSASIVAARLHDFGRQAGSDVVLEFAAVGPSDRDTTIQGVVEVAVIDGGEVVAQTDSEIELDVGVVEGTARLNLRRDISHSPIIRISLLDAEREVLDTYSIDFTGVNEVSSGWSPLQWGAIFLVVLGGISVVIMRKRGKKGLYRAK